MTEKPRIELPQDVKDANLPEDAEKLYPDTFEDTWSNYGRSPRDETRAHAVAWAEVKRQFPREDIDGWKQEADAKKPSTIDPKLQ